MRHQSADAIQDESLACLTDMNRRDHVPDQFQVDLGNGDAGAGSRASDGNSHERLGATVQRQRAEPDVRRARPDDCRIRGVVDPAHRDVGIGARNMQALNPFAVD
jgi:hypothetical protein